MVTRPSSAGSADEPPEFCCPISGDIMEDPVVLVQTGQTFDRKSIQGWFSRGVTTCPVTGEQLQRIQLAPNYALKAMIQQWQQKSGKSATADYPSISNIAYPKLPPSEAPRDKADQIRAALDTLRSSSMGVSSYREQRIYDLWTLSELMADEHCCVELMHQDGLPFVLQFLPEGNSSGCQTAAARTLGRLALSAANLQVYSVAASQGSIACLIRMLNNEEIVKSGELSSREAAAVSLRELATVNQTAKEEVFFQLCAQAKQARNGAGQEPSFLHPLAPLFRVPADSESLAGAGLIQQILDGMQSKDYAPYSSGAGTSVIPSLIDLLKSPGSPAKDALCGLLYTSNQMQIITELVQALPNPDHQFLGISKDAREAAGMLLWEVAAANVNLVAVLNQVGSLMNGLDLALRTRSLAGAGIVQLLTCDHPRPSNSVVTPPNTDAIRLQLLSHDQVLPSLVQQLYSDDQLIAQAAVHALANLTAFRSAAISDSRFPALRRSSSSKFSHHPGSMVADSEAVVRLMALLHCPDADIVAPAIALLNNLCAENENRDKVKEAAKQWGMERLKLRLGEAMAWGMLPDKCRTGARAAMQRLMGSKMERSPAQYTFITLMMKPPQPVSAD